MGKSSSTAVRGRRSLLTAAGTATAATTAVLACVLLPTAAGAAGKTVTTYAELSAQVAVGHDVVLDADITGSTPLVVASTKALSINLNGHSLTITSSGAGIVVPDPTKLTVTDPPQTGEGSLTVTAAPQHAGIEVAPTATFLLNGGDNTKLTATGGTNGAGIGGGAGKDGGTVVIGQGVVAANGGTNAAGIGGGSNGDAGTLLVKVGQVKATGGAGGAGIGGGSKGAGGPVTVRNGFVTAKGGSGAAGVGAGIAGAADPVNDPTDVSVESRGILSTEGAPAITLGKFTNAGIVQVLAGSSLFVPDGVKVAENSGLIRLYGNITGTGTLHNSGTILPTPIYTNSLVTDDGQGPDGSALLITEHNYTLPFELDGLGGTQPDTQHVYAKDIVTAKQTLPPVPAAPGYTCADGWFTAASGGTQVLNTTQLSDPATEVGSGTPAGYGPATIPLHRHCAVVTYTVTFDPQGGSPTPAQQTVPGGEHATQPTAPTKSGQTFTGWYTAATGGTQWNFSTDVVVSDITLYAHYTPATTSPPGSGIGGVSTSTGGGNGSGIAGVSTSLADTGSQTLGMLEFAGLLLAGGLLLAFAGRRRRTTGR